ncbi:pleckstrin homology domain-containing family S member 1 isoform X2 [Petromyzon marinus]|uniref:Pleckstrin homology domain-containing family S member 1 isoform X2 n=1 Tax=Petromyzon marinus TaxID=7757 RepID=A0AAJ7SW10_PETMA|nr:pleckstrin homology domain-containing family S member 1 isoform X2 [Petromyzon marinus]
MFLLFFSAWPADSSFHGVRLTMAKCLGENIICEGYLKKSPPPNKIVFKISISWKKRYCVLCQNEQGSYSFKYYKDEKEFKEGKPLLGEIKIGTLQELTDNPVVPNVIMHRTESVIFLKTESRELFLFAEDREETKKWYLELEKIKLSKSGHESLNVGRSPLKRVNTQIENCPQKICIQKTVSCPPCLKGGFCSCQGQVTVPLSSENGPSIDNAPMELITLKVPETSTCSDHSCRQTESRTVAQQETGFHHSARYMQDLDPRSYPVNTRDDKLPTGMLSDAFNRKLRNLESEKDMKEVSKCITLQDIEKIAFVKFQEQICVAGWKVDSGSALSEILHIGDWVITVGEMKPHDPEDILFFANRYAKNKIPITFARLPQGKLLFAIKTENEDWGIETEGPVIKHIKPRSVIAQHGLNLPICITDQKTVPWQITEINFHSVSLVSADKHSTQRVGWLLNKCTTELFLVLQPKDYIQGLVSEVEKMYPQKEYDTDMH